MPSKLGLSLALLAACATAPDDSTLDQEIVGGTTATVADFPTVVALQHGNGNWFCSGVLIDKDWVLTSASCFSDQTATQVRIGDANLGDGAVAGLTISVAAINKHPQFSLNDTVWRHDVAVLRLAQSITDRTPSTIRRDATGLGASITQAGFGTNSNNGTGGGVLRSLATTNIDCAGANDAGIRNENLLCFNAGDGTGSCSGDGGAPAFVTGTSGARIVAGLASGGTGSSCTSGLDIFTSIVAELSFIDSYVPLPANPPPPPSPMNPPPSSDPDGSGSNPRNPGGDSKGDGLGSVHGMGCNAGGGASWFAVSVVLVAILRRRRRS